MDWPETASLAGAFGERRLAVARQTRGLRGHPGRRLESRRREESRGRLHTRASSGAGWRLIVTHLTGLDSDDTAVPVADSARAGIVRLVAAGKVGGMAT